MTAPDSPVPAPSVGPTKARTRYEQEYRVRRYFEKALKILVVHREGNGHAQSWVTLAEVDRVLAHLRADGFDVVEVAAPSASVSGDSA